LIMASNVDRRIAFGLFVGAFVVGLVSGGCVGITGLEKDRYTFVDEGDGGDAGADGKAGNGRQVCATSELKTDNLDCKSCVEGSKCCGAFNNCVAAENAKVCIDTFDKCREFCRTDAVLNCNNCLRKYVSSSESIEEARTWVSCVARNCNNACQDKDLD
jgi:hypothetical protein